MIASRIGQVEHTTLIRVLEFRPFRPLRMAIHRSSVHQISTTSWSPLVALSLALGALGLVACGASSHSPAPVATVGEPPANIVAPQQIALYPGGSPTHALLEFWQAVQFGDLLNARRLVSPETLAAVTPSRFTTMVQTLGDDIPGLQIVSSTQIGVNAAVRVFLLFYAPNRTVSASAPQTFSLRDGPLGYQLNDLAYFLRTARTVRAAQHKP